MAKQREREAPASDAGQADSELAPAGIASRVGKFVVGILQIQAVLVLVMNPSLAVAEDPVANAGYYVIVALALALLSMTVNLGFDRNWGHRPLLAAGAALAGAGLFDLAAFGQLWGPPVAAVMFTIGLYVHGHMGFSHVLAALLGTPGCEMRAIPHLWARLRGRAALFQPCPGIWTPIDRWEVSLRARLGRRSV